jgi:lipopolysaccharide biosynthesis glycosyltransferase
MEHIRIFIGSEPGNQDAEIALAYSLRTTTSGPYSITWMSDGMPCSVWQHWNKGRKNRIQNTTNGWKTNFSAFRWAIPELCGFEGRAIYLDVDQIVLKDIRELWDLDMGGCSYLAVRPERTDVMLMDCSKFKEAWWPELSKMKLSGWPQMRYRRLVEQNTRVGELEGIHNCLDGDGYCERTRLVHFTKMSTQPWKPFPESIKYETHRDKRMLNIWEETFAKALSDHLLRPD